MGREEKMASTRSVSPLLCWACYICSISSIVYVFMNPVYADPRMNGFVAHMASTVVIFVFTFFCSNTSLYDPAWYLLPMSITIGWVATGIFSIRALYALLGVAFWAARFLLQWPWEGWTKGIDFEDWRFIDLANKVTGVNTPLYWMFSLFGL